MLLLGGCENYIVTSAGSSNSVYFFMFAYSFGKFALILTMSVSRCLSIKRNEEEVFQSVLYRGLVLGGRLHMGRCPLGCFSSGICLYMCV